MSGRTFAKGLKPGLYAVTDSQLLSAHTIAGAVDAAIRGGAVMVQYRDKTSTDTERLHIAQSLQAVCRSHGVPLLVNDDPRLAQRIQAAGVHLGQDDGSVADARALLGDEAIIGVTCHGSLKLAHQARAAGADYLAFGRFFHSHTKSDASAADPRVLAEAAALDLPITAIGGITTANGDTLIKAGADLLAVVGGLFATEDVEHQARAISTLIARHHPLFL
ncbi:thiamine phosphate synthase [Marinobacter sp. X15-166B]|uniref:thiamine phosphate synthase n=1 Tax=Marinobacter sp. X15-166B TaxID=1897620 RepID=UPI00085BC57A|nr:thiamine phosphate synthase [Marinobacter sp. X15-166B]OEY66522.1 thiamine-phosphate diphosphorylase [Marinobacter sp. X15-166B]